MALRLDPDPLPTVTPPQADARPAVVVGSVDGDSLWSRDLRIGPLWRSADKQQLYGQLHTLVRAGLDVRSALELLVDGAAKKHHASLGLLLTRVVGGESVAEAITSVEAGPFEIQSLRIGEATGTLSEAFGSLADFYKRRLYYRSLIVKAVSYPAFVSGFSVLVVGFILYFIVPLFTDIYDRLGGEVPTITSLVSNVSEVIIRFGPLALGTAAIALGTAFYFRKTVRARRLYAAVVLRIPLVGPIIRDAYLARLCSTLRLMLASSIPIDKALALSAEVIDLYPLQRSLDSASTAVREGQSLQLALAGATLLPDYLKSLIRVGEEAHRLPEMFGTVAEDLDRRVESRTETLGSLIEPVLIIGLGFVVGFILISMYLPLFKLGTAIG